MCGLHTGARQVQSKGCNPFFAMIRRMSIAVALMLTVVSSAFAADGVANRTQAISVAQAAIDVSKSRWDVLVTNLSTTVSDLSAKWDAAAVSGGLSPETLSALSAVDTAADTFRLFKSELLADSADVRTKISSQRASTVISLENIKDEISLTYSTLTDAQRDVYRSQADILATADALSASGITIEIARLKARYQDRLAISLAQASQALARNTQAVAAAKSAAALWDEARAAYPRLATQFSRFTVADQERARLAYVTLRDAKDKVLGKIQSNLSDGVASAVATVPRLAAVRADMDAYVSLKVAEISNRLSNTYADADKWFFALSKAQSLLDNQTGALNRAYDAQGVFQWGNWVNTGSLSSAQFARDDVIAAEAALAALGSNTGSLVLPVNISDTLQTFYVAELNSARQAVDSYIRAKADKLSAEYNRIAQLVGMRETALRVDLSSLSDFAQQRARMAQFISEARTIAAGNEEWPTILDASAEKYRLQQDETEKSILKIRLSDRSLRLELQVNTALKDVVTRAVAAGTADQVIAKFKKARAKIPDLLNKKLSDVNRYALLYIAAKIDEFVKKIEG